MRCMMQGSIVDDISNYNRTHEVMSILTSTANRDNEDVSGFGRRWDDSVYYSPNLADRITGNFRGSNSGHFDFMGIAPGESKSVSFKPLCGLLSQGKYLPMMWGVLFLSLKSLVIKQKHLRIQSMGVILHR